MAEYTYEYGKRTIIKNGIVYISTDLTGRIRLPLSLVEPKYRTKKCTVSLIGDKTIQLEYSENTPKNNSGNRITIPAAIREVLQLKRDDFFKVVHRNEIGTVFTLQITDELTEEDKHRGR